MIPLLTAAEMRAHEHRAIHGWGVPSLVLQEHAALGALNLLPKGEPLRVLAGPGNNGGDALALARLARLRGHRVEVWTLDPEPSWRGDAALQATLWEGMGGAYRHTTQPGTMVEHWDGWVVDGLFGLGTHPPLDGLAKDWVVALAEAMEADGAPFQVLALDLPTGLDPSSPEIPGPVIQASRTACFGSLKVCHGLLPARGRCGEISLISLPLPGEPEASLHLVERPGSLWGEAWNTHKRDLGHVGIRAGSPGMGGAAVLAAMGALRMGAGLVTVFTEDSIRSEIAMQVPEAMVQTWAGRVPEGIDVLLVGPGGVTEVPEWDGPLVLDASALKAGEGPGWMKRPETVITPHPGEFARLFGRVTPRLTSERLSLAREVADGPGILVMKGAQSLIAGGGSRSLWVNITGHPGLSTGGTGDFLAGMIAARVGREKAGCGGGSLRTEVAEAVWLHGASADRLGRGPILVRELGVALAGLLKDIEGGEALG